MSSVKRLARSILGDSQYDEVDVARRVLPKSNGFMVDVGAHRGHAHRPFVRHGWTVLAVEPDPENRKYLEGAPSPNVEIVPRAITETDGDRLTLYTSSVSSGISTLAPFHESHVAGVEVETSRLDTLVRGRGHVDFLKVDTEGFDLQVLRTFDWSDMPDAVVCEFEDRKTIPLGYTYRDLGEFLVDKGYVVLMSEWKPIVEYGQEHQWLRVVQFPEAQAAAGSWGNFIAVKPELATRSRRAAKRAGVRLRVRHGVERLLRRR